MKNDEKQQHFSIQVKKMKVKQQENKDLLAIYNQVVLIDFDLTRDIIKQNIDGIQAEINANLKDIMSREV